MKVKELISKLSQCDPESYVIDDKGGKFRRQVVEVLTVQNAFNQRLGTQLMQRNLTIEEEVLAKEES